MSDAISTTPEAERASWWKRPVPLWALLTAAFVSLLVGAGSAGGSDEDQLLAAQADAESLQEEVDSLETELDDRDDALEEIETELAARNEATTTTTAPPVTTTTTTAAPPTTTAPTTTTTAPPVAAAAPASVMPDIACGTDLQLAQDLVQEAGVFFSRSEDATGQDRSQVLDRNWTVVLAEPPAGTPIGEDEAVFYVLKDEEFTGC